MTATAVSLAIAFLSTPLLVRWLGDARFGAARTLLDWFGHLSLLELGLGGAIPPLLALALGKADQQSVLRTLGAGVRAFMLVAVGVLAGGLAIALFAGQLVQVDAALLPDLRTAALVGLVTALLYPLMPFQSLLDAAQRGYIVQWFALAQSVTTAVLALILARAGWGITGQILAIMVGLALFRTGVTLAAARHVPGALASMRTPSDPETTKAIRHLNVATFIFALCGRIGQYTDNIIVAAMIGPAAVTPLFLTQRLAGIAGVQLLGIGNASWAALAELHTLGRREVFAQRLVELTRLLSGLAVAALVPIAAFNDAFVHLWIGAGAFAGGLVTGFACLNAFLQALISLWCWCFGGTGLTKVLLPGAIAGAIINLTVSITATQAIGLAGPLIGTAAGLATVNLWYVPKLLKEYFGVPPVPLLRAALIPVAWGLPAWYALRLLAQRNMPTSWPVLLGAMAASGAVLLLLWWLLALGAPEREAFRERWRAVIRRAD